MNIFRKRDKLTITSCTHLNDGSYIKIKDANYTALLWVWTALLFGIEIGIIIEKFLNNL